MRLGRKLGTRPGTQRAVGSHAKFLVDLQHGSALECLEPLDAGGQRDEVAAPCTQPGRIPAEGLVARSFETLG